MKLAPNTFFYCFSWCASSKTGITGTTYEIFWFSSSSLDCQETVLFDIELLFCFHSLSRDYPNYTFIISALFFFFHRAIRSVQNSRTEWWWRMRKGVDMYVYVFRSWWECTNDIQIYFCKSLSSLAQYKDSSNQNNNDISGRRESPSKKDMKTKYFFRGQNERVIFTFQCGVSKHTVST